MKKIKMMLALLAALVCGGAWAIEPVAKWENNLADGATAGKNNKYTMSKTDGNTNVAFANGRAVTTYTSTAHHGIIVSWPDPSTDTDVIQSEEMTVFVKYNGYTGSQNHALFAAQWEATDKETVVYSNGAHTRVGVSKTVTSTNYGDQDACTSDVDIPTDGIMMISMGNATGDHSGVRVAIAPLLAGGNYGPFVQKHYRDAVKYAQKFKGIKIAGTIGSNSHFHRAGMTVTGVSIYDQAMTIAEATDALPEMHESTFLYYNAYVTDQYASTGWKVGAIDELMDWNFAAEMIGGGIANKPVAARGLIPVKNNDGTVKIEFQASNGETKGVGTLFKIGEDGTVHVKGVGACYFNRTNGATSQMCNADGTPYGPGSKTIAQTLATTYDGGNYGVRNLIATPKYMVSNALSKRSKAGYNNPSLTFNLPAIAGYAAGSKVIVKTVGLATEGAANDLPEKIAINGIKSSSRSGKMAEPSIVDGTTNVGRIIYYTFDEGVLVTVGTAATSFGFYDANDTAVTSQIRFEVADVTGDTGKKLSALTFSTGDWAPICTVVAMPVDEFCFGKSSSYWTNVYQGPAAETAADFHSADQWALASSKTAAALYSNSDNWEPAIVNGDLLTNIEKGDDGYKTIETGSNKIEGWNVRLGLVNGVKLNVGTLRKIQGGEVKFFGVDPTSKMYIASYENGNCENGVLYDIAAPEGIEFNGNLSAPADHNGATMTYIFRGNGSMKVNGSYNIGASHKIKHVELALGTGSKIVMKEKKLIAFTSSNITDANIGFDTNPEIILTDSTTIESGVLTGNELTREDCVGKAAIVKKTDGIYVVYFGYGEEDQTGTLTISGLTEGVSVESVTADGVAVVAGENQTYTIPFGAQVVITYTTTEDGKVVAKPTQTIGYLIKDTTVSTGHPTLVDYPTMSWGSDQNSTYLSRTEASPTLLFASEYSLQDIKEGNCAITGRLRGNWVNGLYDTRIVVGEYDKTAGTLKIQAQIYQDYTKVQTITLSQIQIGDKYLIFALGSLGYYVTDKSDQRGNFVEKTSACTSPSSGDGWNTAYEAIALSLSTTTVASIDGVNYSSIAKAIAEANGHTIMLEADITEGLVVPNGVTVNLNGHTLSGVVRVEFGGLLLEKVGENSHPKIDGYTTSFDIFYNNTKDFAYKQEPTATSNIGQGTASYFPGDENNSLCGIYLKHQPYIGNIPGGFFDNTSQLTMAIVGTMPSEQNTIFAHMGDAYDNTKYGVFLATGSKTDEVVVRYNNGQSSEEIASMTVPKASTARHLYIITKQDSETKAVFTVYLDGQKWKTATYDKFIIKGGVQLGNTFNATVSGYDSIGSSSTAYVNALRIYDRVISAAEIARYKEEFAYKSLDGNFERTFTAGAADWSATGAWAKTSVDPTITVDLPTAGVVDAIFDGATTVTVNSDAVNYEKLTLSGTGPVTLTKGNEATALKAVCAIVNTQVTLGEGAIDLTTGPTVIGESGKIIFDFSSLTTAGIIATPLNLPVTGDIDEDPNLGTESAKLVMSCNESNIDRDQVCVKLVYDSANNCYNAFAQRWAASYAGTNYLTLQEALDAAEEASALPTAVTIKDGTTELPEGYDDYAVADNGSIVAAVAKVGGKGYLTLPSAVEAATEGQTVTLLADVTLSATVAVVSGVTLDIGSYTVSGQITVYGYIAGNGSIRTLSMAQGATVIMPVEGCITVTNIARFQDMIFIENAPQEKPVTYMKVKTFYVDPTSGYEFIPMAVTFRENDVGTIGRSIIVEGEMNVLKSDIAVAGLPYAENVILGFGSIQGAIDMAEYMGGNYSYVLVYNETAEVALPYAVSNGRVVMAAAKIGEKGYATLAAALSAAQANETVTLLAANSETVTIPANVTVDVNGQTFSGTVSGSGKIKYAGFAAVSDAVKTSLRDSEHWTGTLVITQPTSGQIGENDNTVDGSSKTLLNNYGNVYSKIEFEDCTGNGDINYMGISHNGESEPIVIQPEIVITGNVKLNNGYTQRAGYPNNYTIIRKLSGTGTINSTYAGQVYYIQDGSAFAGSITTTAKKFVFGNRESTDGVITDAIIAVKVGKSVTIAPDKTWSANAIVVNGTLTKSNGATLTGGDNNKGKVSGSGEIIVVGSTTAAGIGGHGIRGLTETAWTGTFTIKDWNGADGAGSADFGGFGNVNSTVRFDGYTGYFKVANYNQIKAYDIAAGGLTLIGYYSTGTPVFKGNLIGSGSIAVNATGGRLIKFVGDHSGYTGTITVANTACVALVDSADAPVQYEDGKVVYGAGSSQTIPQIPEGTTVTVAPGSNATVTFPEEATPEQKAAIAEQIVVKYGNTVLNPTSGTKYVNVTVNETTGKVELTTTDAAKPVATAIAMSTPTEGEGEEATDKVQFTITNPIPGLFYAVSSCDTPDGDFESATGDQATSSETKTVSIPMTFTGDKKVKYYKVSVKATK